MRALDDDALRDFLLSGTRTAKLATVDDDGSPHVVPVWFVLDGPDLVLTTSSRSRKARNLRRDGRACVCVDDDTPPYSFATVWADAVLLPRPPDLAEWATRIAERYVGRDRAAEVGSRNAQVDDLLVRLRPRRSVGQADLVL